MAEPFVQDADLTIHVGDVSDVLETLPDGSVDCVVTSPPYWGLRDYGTPGQLGLEPTPDLYVARMVGVFREVRRVLAPHGTCWVNLGDSYATGLGRKDTDERNLERRAAVYGTGRGVGTGPREFRGMRHPLKPKDLVGIPWRVAFALQADGWYLRSDIIWSKPNPMPESVTDRPTKAHEYVFLLTKQSRYWFDAEAVRERAVEGTDLGLLRGKTRDETGMVAWGAPSIAKRQQAGIDSRNGNPSGSRNVRSVWEIATQPYPEAHFATYPEELVRRCILAGCPEWVCGTCGKPRERIVETDGSRWAERVANGEPLRHGVSGVKPSYSVGSNPRQIVGWSDCGHNNYRPGRVLDPFLGSGTTALVARKHGRHTVGIELNPEYARLAAERTRQLSLLDAEYEPAPTAESRPRGLTGGAYAPPGQTPHSNARQK